MGLRDCPRCWDTPCHCGPEQCEKEHKSTTSYKIKQIKRSEIKALAEQYYYSNVDTKEHWEPFEYYEPEQLEEEVLNLACGIENFLKNKGLKIKED